MLGAGRGGQGLVPELAEQLGDVAPLVVLPRGVAALGLVGWRGGGRVDGMSGFTLTE